MGAEEVVSNKRSLARRTYHTVSVIMKALTSCKYQSVRFDCRPCCYGCIFVFTFENHTDSHDPLCFLWAIQSMLVQSNSCNTLQFQVRRKKVIFGDGFMCHILPFMVFSDLRPVFNWGKERATVLRPGRMGGREEESEELGGYNVPLIIGGCVTLLSPSLAWYITNDLQ